MIQDQKVKSLEIDEFSEWRKWPQPALSQLPAAPGVYVFRLHRSFGRINGESDILYIGKSGKSIRSRLKCHPFNRTSMRILGLIEVAWKACASGAEANVLESRLIGRYQRKHLELPPFNRQQPFTLFQQYLSSFAQLSRVAEIDQRVEEKAVSALHQLERLASFRIKSRLADS